MVTLARLGASVGMLDSLGDDWRSALILAEFAREGVETRFIQAHSAHTASTATVLVRRADAARSIVYCPGSAPELAPHDLPRAEIESARCLHVNGRHWAACLQAVHWARAAGVIVSFDGGAGRYRPEMRQLVPLVDVCIAAREFAERYTGAEDLAQAAALLAAEGPRLVVITEGRRGSWVHPAGGKAFHQPAFLSPQTIDTTGCGDSYHGAFLYGLLQGWDARRTAAVASAVASLNSRALGGRAGLPTLAQAEALLANSR
jgi:sugar/nucleoside kinase (ribokinase family)